MKNFKLNAVRLGRKTKTGKRIYKLSGNTQSLEFYREMQGEYLREDEDGAPLFFTSTLAQNGIITFNEENERFYLEPDFASEVMIEAAMRSFRTPEPIAKASDSEEDPEEADLDKPAEKPKGTRRSLKKNP